MERKKKKKKEINQEQRTKQKQEPSSAGRGDAGAGAAGCRMGSVSCRAPQILPTLLLQEGPRVGWGMLGYRNARVWVSGNVLQGCEQFPVCFAPGDKQTSKHFKGADTFPSGRDRKSVV